MLDVTRAVSPTALGPLFNTSVAQPPQAEVAPTPPPPAGSGKKNDALGRDEFLQLLVAQMKNQDPLNPMDGQEMAAQLAQFSQVEQLIEIKAAMQTVAANQAELGLAIEDLSAITVAQGDAMALLLEQSMAINTVGRTGVLTGDQLFVDRDGSGGITIDAGSLEGVGRLTVVDADGNSVATSAIAGVQPGMQYIDLADFTFDPPLQGGRYSFRFEVTNPIGVFQPARTYTTGRITGLRYEAGQPTLVIGDTLSAPFSSLLQLRR
jgi:flagellar basal-body rod modification protein FlgD